MAALALLLGVVLVTGCAPVLLNQMIVHRVEPQAVLVTWMTLVVATFLTVVATLVIAVLPGHGPVPVILELVDHCWNAMRHGSMPRLHEMTALVLLVVVVAVTVQWVQGLLRFGRQQRRLHDRQLGLLRIAAIEEPGPIPTMWLPHHEPLAYSVAGTPAFVVATQGVRDQLSEPDTAAVIEHERSHLRGRHHLLVGIAEALATSVPWVPLTRDSPAVVRTAVELVADRVAARAHGAQAVRTALRAMTGAARAASPPGGALCMADRCVALRLRHLEGFATRRSPVTSALINAIAGMSAATLPALIGTIILGGIGLITCPMLLGA